MAKQEERSAIVCMLLPVKKPNTMDERGCLHSYFSSCNESVLILSRAFYSNHNKIIDNTE